MIKELDIINKELLLKRIEKIETERERERIQEILSEIAHRANSSLYFCHENIEEMRSTITQIGQLTIKATEDVKI